ncbi:hypothetical protein R0J89_16740, partial [Psychrobacter sp. SIMBA_152]
MNLVATPTYADGGHSPALGAVTWSTSDSGVLSVAGGLVTAIGAGTATLSAVSGPISGSLDITVTTATFQSIAVTPAGQTVALG